MLHNVEINFDIMQYCKNINCLINILILYKCHIHRFNHSTKSNLIKILLSYLFYFEGFTSIPTALTANKTHQ